jgi:hypothetical protein
MEKQEQKNEGSVAVGHNNGNVECVRLVSSPCLLGAPPKNQSLVFLMVMDMDGDGHPTLIVLA